MSYIFYLQPPNKLPSNESTTTSDSKVDQTISETSRSDVASNKDGTTQSIDNNDISPISSSTLNSNVEQHTVKGDDSVTGTISGTISSNEVRHVAEHDEISGTVTRVETVPPASDGDLVPETPLDGQQGIPSPPLDSRSVDITGKDNAIDSVQHAKDTESPMKIDQDKSQAASVDAPMDVDTQLKDVEVKAETRLDQIDHQENKDVSPAKVQEQLDEVKYVNKKGDNIILLTGFNCHFQSLYIIRYLMQDFFIDYHALVLQAQGLLKSAISTGQSKEARLARVKSLVF